MRPAPLVAVALWAAPTVAAAADAPVQEIEVEGRRSGPDEVAGHVTVVPVDERLPGSADVATAVGRAPGTTVLRLGGIGAQSSVGIRGSAARQVEVMIDGVPLNPEGGSAIDLSELPLRAFERVEVYRGAVPPSLGSVALGGVVNLVTGEGRTTASVGAGSFGSARATLGSAGSTPLGELWIVADGLVTEGGFAYLDDGGTRLDPSDDLVVDRVNNDVEQGAVHLRWRHEARRVSWSALNVLLGKEQGVAGFSWAPASEVRYRVVRDLQTLQAEGASGAVSWRGRGWGLLRVEALDDPVSELGVGGPATRTDRIGMLGAHGWIGWAAARAARLDATVDARAEGADADADGGTSGPEGRSRRVARSTVALTTSTADGGLALSPTVALLVLDDRDPEAAARAAYVLPRLVGEAGVGPVRVVATGGWFARPPDLLELFGDRGVLVGNPTLRPERSTQADLGVTWTDGGARAEVVGFHRAVTDLITLQQTPQGVARPENVSEARISGAELAASVEGARGWCVGNATLQHAIDATDHPAYGGKRLPRVPAVALGAQTGLVLGPVTAGWDLTVTSGTWLDRANFTQQAPRPLHGATLGVRDRDAHWWIEADVRNLADRTVQPVPADPLVQGSPLVGRAVEDFVGYPLPGRSLWLTLRWTP